MGTYSAFLNHKPIQFNDSTSLKEVLLKSGIEARGIAVAINNQVISKENWNSVLVKDNDQITVIQATQGG